MRADRPPLLAPPPQHVTRPSLEVSLSVLVPAYNAADTIGEALESALTQTPRPAEVIVSDDGSEDDLASVLRRFDSHVRVVRGPNRGLATARNRAARIAEGTYLALLDADDVWLPGRAAALSEAARARPDLDILTTDARVVREGRRDADTYYEVRTWPEGDQVEAILSHNFIFGAGAIARDAFRGAGGYDEMLRYAEDWDLYLRLILGGSRAGLIDSPLYEYRRRPDSLTAQRVELALGVIDILERVDTAPLTRHQRNVLKSTVSSWRARAAHEAIKTHHPDRLSIATTQLRRPRTVLDELGRLADPGRGVRSVRRRLRPVRARARRILGILDPARFTLPTRTDRARGVAFVAVYRARNAEIVTELLDGLPPDAAIRLWALDDVVPELASHTVGCGGGTRFELLNGLIEQIPQSERRGGLVVSDDDLKFVVGDAQRLVALGRRLNLDLFQPAHSGDSFASLSTVALVGKKHLVTARHTRFIEQGPLLVMSSRAQAELLPFPEDLGMGWGAEVRWSRIADRSGLRLGVVDAAVVRHLVPPAGAYDTDAEEERLATELERAGVSTVADLQDELGRVGLIAGLRLGRGRSALGRQDV